MTPDEFRAIRAALGWSRVEMAKRLGYASETSIRQIEDGRTQIDPRYAEWLRKASAYLRAHPAP